MNRFVAMLVKPRPAAGPVEVPDLSHLHWVSGWPPVAHAYRGGGPSLCLQANIIDRGQQMSTDEIRRLRIHREARITWCPEPACFPGRRCKVCGVPSGSHDECAGCLRTSIDVDKRIERAA